jgi:hypothetical protein
MCSLTTAKLGLTTGLMVVVPMTERYAISRQRARAKPASSIAPAMSASRSASARLRTAYADPKKSDPKLIGIDVQALGISRPSRSTSKAG